MDFINSPCWYDALTLRERLVALRARGELPSDGASLEASPRLEAWRRQPPFEREGLFARRLAADGLTEAEFARVLAEPAEVVQRRSAGPPDWMVRLVRAFDPAPGETRPGQAEGEPAFLELARPLVADASARLREALLEHARRGRLPFDVESAVGLAVPHLAARLSQLLDRTLVLELNVARLRGELEGETPQARFRSFLLRLRTPERALTLLAEYPVLARQMVRVLDHGIASHLEFLERLAADWEALRTSLNQGRDPGRLEALDAGQGDSHRQGRSVLIARFSSGFRVVYKPRALALDQHFQELLAWLNARGHEPPLRLLQVIDRQQYGWVEYVDHSGCATPQEVERFYRRQGAYLALLYALDATDFHMDNLIAQGEHPMLLDLEALFHARVGGTVVPNPAHQLALRVLENSVLRIGLLPRRIWANAESEGVDMSGLGAVAGQMSPFRVPQWQKTGTDEMHLGRERVPMEGGRNRPTLAGAEVDVLDHAEAICLGFAATYRLLEEHRAELLAPGGPLARFSADEVRAILRPTHLYGVLLRESVHPNVLRNALERAQLFDRLWISAEHLTHLARAIPAEVDDLDQGDIPMFTTRPDSRDLWTSGGERLPEFFAEPSLSHVRRRVLQLGPEDLERQLWFVRASLATASSAARGRRGAGQAQAAGTIGPEEILLAARALGDELARRALVHDRSATWLGLTQPGEGHWTLTPLGLDLYDGLPGVALFLAYLAALTGEGRYAELAQAALRTMRQFLAEGRSEVTSLGAFNGLGGVIYALAHLEALLADRGLLHEARAAVDCVPSRVQHDQYLDVIGGAAGCIGALLALHRRHPSPEVLAAARQCGDRLVETARPMEAGVGWITTIAKARPLSGFSHGAAGMAWALLALAEATGEEGYRRTALEGIAYERTLFSPEHQNWLDLREGGAASGSAPGLCTTWCHGAPGIGLARLATLRSLDDERVREEIQASLATAVRSGFGDNHSLCHGDLGNLELLAVAAQVLGDEGLRASAERIACGIVRDGQSSGWKCGNPLRVEAPGLMTGLSGVGYGLLRLADPARVPSVLL
ncbi:MAG TPA: type 2 lanthipeptide synthetase LanM family protein, partial [Anaeromyxobacteraceae bacterium]|nr:type 2 lanthipeptide synthetase LanM family protein [Anaeromyxobacteraceae bacterium]